MSRPSWFRKLLAAAAAFAAAGAYAAGTIPTSVSVDDSAGGTPYAGQVRTATAQITAASLPATMASLFDFRFANGGGIACGARPTLDNASGATVSCTYTVGADLSPLVGVYNGNATYLPSQSGPISPPMTPAQCGAAGVTLSGSATVQPSGAGQGMEKLTVVVNVAGPCYAPTGLLTVALNAQAACQNLTLVPTPAPTVPGWSSVTCVVDPAPQGNVTVGMSYGGDGTYPAKNGQFYTNVPLPSTLQLSSSVTPSVPGQVVRLDARVSAFFTTSDHGFVTFYVDGAMPCGAVQVASNFFASCSVVFDTVGNHDITATFAGTGFAASTASMVQHVSPLTPTVTLTSAVNPTAPGQPAVFHALVSGSGAAPTGIVGFRGEGNVPLHGCESAAIYNGMASCSTGSLGYYAYNTITAVYLGDVNYGSVSATLTQGAYATRPAPTRAKPRDFSGDGRSDIVWMGADGSVSVWLMDGVNILGRAQVFGPSTGSTVFSGDFDGDGKADLVRQDGNGNTLVLLMNGVDAVNEAYYTTTAPGKLVGVGDFDGDGKADLLWRTSDGSLVAWLMDGVSAVATGTVHQSTGTAAKAGATVFIADFNADGRDDILDTGADGAGTVSMMIMDGTTATSTTTLMSTDVTGWYPVKVADFNADGAADIVWAHPTGATSLWLMNGPTVLQRGPLLPSGSSWRVASVGDFNGDGKSDIMFRNSIDGSVGRWFMNGLTPLQKNTLLPAGSPWAPAAALDVSGDNSTDMLWQANDGSVGLWILIDPSLPFVPPRRTLLGPNTMWTPLP